MQQEIIPTQHDFELKKKKRKKIQHSDWEHNNDEWEVLHEVVPSNNEQYHDLSQYELQFVPDSAMDCATEFYQQHVAKVPHKNVTTSPKPSEIDYAFADMLHRIYENLENDHPSLFERVSTSNKTVQVQVPKVAKYGSKRTVILEFDALCKQIRRPMEHVMQFLQQELHVVVTLDQQESATSRTCMVQGVFHSKQMESVLRKYITQYVACTSCGNIDTILTRDRVSRIYTVSCMSCNAHRTVASLTRQVMKRTNSNRSLASYQDS